ncbi:uncharacterized protein LOC122052158 isoform X1 [Zingiber officinale]|uniref:Uncharacterized protein n=2 Tax=Zingiber officinale TaxID=94328 RepID=A0A8J5LIV7_ZINOF|nr:uncharacterized protein LOC122052158 isoform X1 [Zingiber officinale]XP_042469489.1 uncharacterized protein LOC122052158 isoform X1 [Zingiber officinale]XP_042469490.1 uncharacterized protein LOC122052158 isoform X1 [Zingiber officinale]KAG6521506.1 hypothetical protein ZIOFF_018627 [Zingiber officinale]
MAIGGALRNTLRLVSARCLCSLPLLSRGKGSCFSSFPITSTSALAPSFFIGNQQRSNFQKEFFSTSTGGSTPFGNMTETRFPKRRPGTKPRKKRASLRPRGPYAWVQYVPGEPIPRSRPNEGSVQGRNRKKRIRQRKAFILSEKKKRKAQYAAFRKKRDIERIQRKMAAVAREKDWAERLIELQNLEEKKKAAATA